MEENILAMHISSFPDKSNTFVVNEVIEMVSRGISVKIYSESLHDTSLFPELEKAINDGSVELIDTIKEGLYRWRAPAENKIPLLDNTYRQILLNESHFKKNVEKFERDALDRCETVFGDMAKRIKEDGASVIYSPFASHDADICMMLSELTGLPFFFSCHSKDLYSSFHYGSIKCEKAQGIFCITNYNKEFLKRSYGAEDSKLHIKRVNFLEKDNIKKFTPGFEYIYSAGRLYEMKGFEWSIKAFSKLISKKGNENLHYIISGSGESRDSLVNLVSSLGIEDRVHIEEHLSNEAVLSYIKGSLFCVLTSVISPDGDREGLPTFFIESMSLGKPCIGTNYSGIPEIIDHGKNGFVCEPKNIPDIFRCMKKLQEECDKEDESFSHNCKLKVMELFDNKFNTSVLVGQMFPNL